VTRAKGMIHAIPGKLCLVNVLLHWRLLEARPDHRAPEAVAPCLLQHGQLLRESGKDAIDVPGLVPRKKAPVTSSLVQIQSSDASSMGSKTDTRVDPSFFDSFSDAESTFDADGQSEDAQAKKPSVEVADPLPTIEPPQWFVESESAGPKQAWQTYDALTEDASWRAAAPEWEEKEYGRVEQSWNPLDSKENGNTAHSLPGKDPAWFNVEADQYDWFGRPRAPTPASASFYLEWSQVSRTADLSCGPPGCVANTSLEAFQHASDMEYKMCTLSLFVHATDFDDAYNVEKIEWIVINGKEALRDFSPRAPKGCEINDNLTGSLDSDLVANESIALLNVKGSRSDHRRIRNSSELPLFPCIRDMPLEGLVGADGKLHVSGKISPAVDECPVNGNHFSGVVTVTCFARATTTLPPTTTTTTEPVKVAVQREFKTRDSARVACKAPGCSATATLSVDSFNLTSRKCGLTLRINQTDFDEQDGSAEHLEWIKVNSKTVATNVKPGKNPCKEAVDAGSNRTSEVFVALNEEDVTDAIKEGVLSVEVKITDMVDECAVENYLLDGQAEVACT